MSNAVHNPPVTHSADPVAGWLKSAIDHAAVDEIYLVDANGNILYANDSACNSLGYSREELLSLSVFDINPAITRAEFKKSLKKSRKQGRQTIETVHRKKDGTLFPVEVCFDLETIDGREVNCSVVRDISERKARQKEFEQLRFALKKAADAVYLTDTEGNIHFVNNTACRMLGYSENELLSMNIFDIDIAINTDSENEEHRRLMLEKEGIFETRHRKKDGNIIPVEITFSNEEFDGTLFSFSFARDITERKEAEKRNRELSFAIENAVDAVYLFDDSGRIFYTNSTACRMLKYSYDELLSMNVMQLNPAIPEGEWQSHFNRIRKEGLPPFEAQHRRKDGSWFPVEITVGIEILDGEEYFCAFVRDISERKAAERRSWELNFIIDNAKDAVYTYDFNGKIRYANEIAAKETGYTRDELMQMSILDLEPELTKELWQYGWERLRTNERVILESRHQRKDGTCYPVEISMGLTTIDGIEYSCAFVRDITERKEAERRNEELSFAIENAVDAVYLNDEKGNIFYANKSACESLGYSFDELTSMNIGDIDEDFNPEVLKLLVENRIEEIPPPPPEARHRRKDGSTYPVEVTFNSRVIDGTRYFCSFARDITERKRTRSENEKLRTAIDQALDAVYIFDAYGRIQYANESAARETGYSIGELQKMRVSDIDPTVHETPEREALGRRRWEEGLQGEKILFESIHRRKDGSTFPVECSHSGLVSNEEDIGISFVRNITERKKQLRQNEELRFAIENSIDAVYLATDNGEIYYVNKSACRMLGYTYEELTSMTVFDIDPMISREFFAKQWHSEWRDEASTFESLHRRKDGAEFSVEVSSRVTEFEGMEYACSFVRDITERKESLRHMEEFRFAIDNANDPVYLYDSEANIIYGNKRACETLGYSPEEITNLKVWDIDPDVTADVWQEIYPKIEAGEFRTFESTNRRKDGTVFPVEVTANNVTYGDYKFGCSFNHDITERKLEEQRLLFLQFAIDSAGDAIFITTPDGEIQYANQSACDSLGYSREELLQLRVPDINPEVDKLREDIELWENNNYTNPHIVESVHRCKDGTTFPIEIQAQVMVFDGKKFSCAVVRDITERKKVEEALLESEERFRVIAETSPVALIISRASDGSILYANNQVQALFNLSAAELVGTNISSLFNTEEARQEIQNAMQSGSQTFGRELLLKRRDGSTLCLSLNARTISLQGEDVICNALLDITEAHELAEQLSYQASYDALTDLVNRREFLTHLQRVLVSARQAHTENALCFLDLDQFKIVNDTCGHIAGDQLLKQLGQLLQNNVRKRDILARLGGDEFAILLENCNLQQAERVARSMRQAVQDFRFCWEEHTFNIGVSIGLVPVDWTSETAIDILRRADTACYTAKDMGRNRIHIYHPDDEELTKRHGEMQWISRVNEALQENRLQLWAQRIMPLSRLEKTGDHFEVLLRLQDKDGNIVSPDAFLPTAERYNIAPRIDRWVVTTILNWFDQNPDKFDALAMCSINLSGQSLSNEELLNYIVNYFAHSKLDASKFCFEVTETAAIANLAYATHFINVLREHGCKFALDDFGSGLSSFAYLKNLPVDYIKIDGQFVKDILEDPIDLAMVKSINEVGQVMGKITIAEFVENDALLEKLREVGVDYAQGYGIARPAPLITGSAILKIYQ